MYDLVPPSMKAQFNSINLPNQSIKLHVNIYNKIPKKKRLSEYTYNKNLIFKYSIILNNSLFELNIYVADSKKNHFYKTVLGSFIYDTSIKYLASEIVINANLKSILEASVFGFLQKDFLYSVHKKNSNKSKYKTNFKLTKNYLSLLNSQYFLKELVY